MNNIGIIKLNQTYRHKTTGNLYITLAFGIDKSTQVNPQRIIYCPDDDGNSIYIREIDDFIERFERI